MTHTVERGERPRFRAVKRMLLPGALCGLLLVGGSRRLGPVPPLGPFLDPVAGVWAVAGSAELADSLTLDVSWVSDTVIVLYDRRHVPHVFARNELDAAAALGYVVARDRLFQLEMQTRATEGTLTEVAGSQVLELDRAARRLGLARSARRDWELSQERERRRLTAYARGVNAWVESVGRRNLPLEYRLLDVEPARWEPWHTLLFIKRMGWNLAGFAPDLQAESAARSVGRRAAAALFPIHSSIVEPIVPGGSGGPRFDFSELPPPSPRVRTGDSQQPSLSAFGLRLPRAPVSASNNWVVGPGRTGRGAMLAGDPHLDMQLPSVWYEAHTVVEGLLDVYGATFPGVPQIVIGFNRNVAWSFTNTGADVMDFYRETVNDSVSPTAYLLDGEWRSLEFEVEEFRDRSGSVIAVDTVRYTHRGPLAVRDGQALSMRWLVLDDESTMRPFERMLTARSVQEWMEAMSEWVTPAQNGAVADVHGSIGIGSLGSYPVRPGDGDGRWIRDGSLSSSDWLGFRSFSRQYAAVNPAQGYLASANQEPVDPLVDPGYLSANWEPPWRALRINRLLRNDSMVTAAEMGLFQTDPGSERAELFVPFFLAAARSAREMEVTRQDLDTAAALLAEWDRRYTVANERAVLFERAMRLLSRLTWDELPTEAIPAETRLAQMLEYPESIWWDRASTRELREDRDMLLAEALAEAYRETVKAHGAPSAGGWRWGGIQQANIYHLMRFPSLSALGIPIQGGRGTLNPSSGPGVHGASWRMVLDLTDSVRAWTTYPGGQSGNSASSRYDDRLEDWKEGVLNRAYFPRRPEEVPVDSITATVTMIPRK